MSQTMILAGVALVASAFLLSNGSARTWAVIATITSGVIALISLGFIQLNVAGLPLGIIFGALLAVAGVFIYLKVKEKLAIASGTVVAFVGALLVLAELGI